MTEEEPQLTGDDGDTGQQVAVADRPREPSAHRNGRSRRRRRRRRVIKRTIGVSFAFLLVVAGVAVWRAIALRGDLEAAEGALSRGQAALLAGEAATARAAFGRAGERLGSVNERLDGTIWTAAARLPRVGPSVTAASTLVDATLLVARAGTLLSASLDEVQGGLGLVAAQGGAIPLPPLQQVAPDLTSAAELVEDARQILDAEPPAGTIAQLRSVFTAARADTDRAAGVLSAAAAMATELPAFLGADGPKRYFLAAANLAELRGTGGYLGAYTVMTADAGRLSFGEFAAPFSLPRIDSATVAPPNADYLRRYGAFGGPGFWPNINMTPDFPTAADAIVNLYEATSGERLNGVIVVDPFMLAALVGPSGTVEVPGLGPVAGKDLVSAVSVDARAVFDDQGERKEVLGEVAKAVLFGFLNTANPDQTEAAARRLVDATGAGHMLLNSQDADTQAAFGRAGVAGALAPLGPTTTDYFSWVANNASASKLDAFMQRTVTYRIQLEPGGSATAEATIELRNDASPVGLDQSVIGPGVDYLSGGESFSYLSYYCDVDCSRIDGSRDGTATDAPADLELGFPVYTSWEQVRAGSTRSLTHRLRLDDAWALSDDVGRYGLVFADQVQVRPTRLIVEIAVPAGEVITQASPGLQVQDGIARWEGDGRHLTRFDVRFGKP